MGLGACLPCTVSGLWCPGVVRLWCSFCAGLFPTRRRCVHVCLLLLQVRDLMVYIEAQRTIQAEGGSELQEATLLPMPQSKGSSARSRRCSSKK